MKRTMITKRLARWVYFGVILLFSGCVEVPSEGSIAPDINYRNRKQYAISGLEQYIGDFNFSTSTLPIYFEIVNIRETNGGGISKLKEELPVIRYKEPIVGGETPEELQLKTELVTQPAVTINSNTGKIEVLEGNTIPAGEYRFDIQVTNTSGSTLLTDAIIIEFKEFEVTSWAPGMAKEPVIERIADSPNQILFVGYLNGEKLHGNRIDFTTERSAGFKGTFVNDTEEGEIWNVNFPVKNSNTFCTWKVVEEVDGEEQVSYLTENFNFVLGLPGSYVIRLYK